MKEQYTIDILKQRSLSLQKEINKSRQSIVQKWDTLFAPPQAETKVQYWVSQAEKAVAVYDGFMMMYKLGRRFNHISQLFKRKKK